MAEVINVDEHVEHVFPKPRAGGAKAEMLGGQGYRGLPTFAGYWLHARARGVANKESIGGPDLTIDSTIFEMWMELQA